MSLGGGCECMNDSNHQEVVYEIPMNSTLALDTYKKFLSVIRHV